MSLIMLVVDGLLVVVSVVLWLAVGFQMGLQRSMLQLVSTPKCTYVAMSDLDIISYPDLIPVLHNYMYRTVSYDFALSMYM